MHEITLNGRRARPVVVRRQPDRADRTWQADNELRVVADCAYSHTGEGLHRFVDPADKLVYLYTQFEVPDARRVFTTFEQPDLKATFTFHVTAPSHWQVVSNSPTPEPVEELGLGQSVWHFEPTKPMSTYITALVAGEYAVVRDTYRGAAARSRSASSSASRCVQHLDADDIFEVTKQGFAFFEDAFDMAYPFGKYDQLFVPEYNMGAMENAGCVTFRDEYIFRSRQTRAAYEGRANTILHEMAHMWFGDLVTMKWWDDLWLNESFAEWASHQASADATQYDDAWTNFCNARKTWAYRQDQLPSTHPIAADNYDLEAVEVNFDGITYAKGASALRQLVAWVGEDEFFAGLRVVLRPARLRQHRARRPAQGARGDLGPRARLVDQGVAADVRRQHRAAGASRSTTTAAFTSFAVEQTAHPEFPTLRRHRLAVGLYDLTDGGLDAPLERRDRRGRATRPRCPSWSASSSPTWCCSTTATSPTRRCGSTSARWPPWSATSTASTTRCRGPCRWGAALGHDARRARCAPRDWVDLVLRGLGVETDLFAVRSLVARTRPGGLRCTPRPSTARP